MRRLTVTFTAQLGSGHKGLTFHKQPGSTAPAFATRLYSPGFRDQALQPRQRDQLRLRSTLAYKTGPSKNVNIIIFWCMRRRIVVSYFSDLLYCIILMHYAVILLLFNLHVLYCIMLNSCCVVVLYCTRILSLNCYMCSIICIILYCYALYVLYYMYCIVCIVLYVLYYMYSIVICFVLYLMYYI